MKFLRSLLVLCAAASVSVSVSGAEKIRKRILPAPVVVSQAQLKYPLETSRNGFSYYTRWTDWPLFMNCPPDGNKNYRGLSDQEYLFLAKTVKNYGMDGFSPFLPSEKKISECRTVWNDFAAMDPECKLLPIWNLYSHPDSVRLALESPATLKINGKVPILFYGVYPEAKRKELTSELKNRYPDQLLLLLTDGLYDNAFENKFRKGTVTEKDVEQIKDNLRNILRDGDGFYLARRPRNFPENGVLYRAFYEYTVKLISEVMAEPEFENKLMALPAGVEHCNSGNIGYSLISDGTATLRGFMDIALKYNADIINIPEWDEENENSSLRPTVFKGLSLMRLMRYYTSLGKNQTCSGLPGDDTSLPNLIVSFRKMLVPGEKFKLELLHIPDGVGERPYEAQVKLKSADGRDLHTFPSVKLGGNGLQNADLILPSEKLVGEPLLIPELTLKHEDGSSWNCASFGAAALVPTAINDYEEIHLGIRDVLQAEKAEFTVSPLPDKKFEVGGKFLFKENVRYLELLENGRCIYSFTAPGEPTWRDDREYAALEISLMSALRPIKCSGEISITAPEAAWKTAQVVNSAVRIEKNRVHFRNMTLSNWETRAVAAIPRKKLAGCQVKVAIPGFCEQSFSFEDLLKLENYAIYGKNGFVLSFSRQGRQEIHPRPQDRKDFAFSVVVTQEKADSVLMFQAVTPEGRQFRSKAFCLNRGGNVPLRTVAVWSDTEKRPVKLQVSADRTPEIDYLFTDRHGSTLPAEAGRNFWASRGGYTMHSTGKGGGATSFYGIGNLPATGNYSVNVVCGMPELRREDSKNILYFDGIGNYITLPQGVIPRRTAFSMELTVCPDEDFSGNCLLIGSQTCRGTHSGLRIYLRKGFLCYEFMDRNQELTWRETGIQIPNGRWTALKITRDLENIIFELDGKTAGSFPCPNPGIFDTLAVVGGSGKGGDYFKGKIGKLKVRPYLE